MGKPSAGPLLLTSFRDQDHFLNPRVPGEPLNLSEPRSFHLAVSVCFLPSTKPWFFAVGAMVHTCFAGRLSRGDCEFQASQSCMLVCPWDLASSPEAGPVGLGDKFVL